MKCEAGRLLAWDWAGNVSSLGGKATGVVTSGAEVGLIARLLRTWVRLDVAGTRSVVAGGVAEDDGIGIAWLDDPRGMASVGGIGMAWLVEVWVTVGVSNLTPLRTIGAVILQTRKTPVFKLQLTFVVIKADSTSCRLDFWLDVNISLAPLRLKECPGLFLVWARNIYIY